MKIKKIRVNELLKHCKILRYMRKNYLNGNNEVYTSLKETVYQEAKSLKLTHRVADFLSA